MHLLQSTAVLAGALHLVSALPSPEQLKSRQTSCANTTLSGATTLTAYAEGNSAINGLKLQLEGGLAIGVATVSQYCPTEVNPCPNGTDSVFYGLEPDSEVPGGQYNYLTPQGQFQVTVQHEEDIPPNAYPIYTGWQYHPFTQCTDWCDYTENCPADNPIYNCQPPLGYYTFQLPGSSTGGVYACPTEGSPTTPGSVVGYSVWAAVPGFNATGCTQLTGLGAHNYTGPSPPVWAYY